MFVYSAEHDEFSEVTRYPFVVQLSTVTDYWECDLVTTDLSFVEIIQRI